MCACARVRVWVRERDEGDGMMGSAKDNLVMGGGGSLNFLDTYIISEII